MRNSYYKRVRPCFFFQRYSTVVRFASCAAVRYTLGRIAIRSTEGQGYTSGFGCGPTSGCHFGGRLFRSSRRTAFVRETRHQLSGIVPLN